MARIRVLLRRKSHDENRPGEPHIFENGDLRIDYSSNCVYVGGVEIRLTPLEYKLLCLLARNVGKVLT